MPRRSCKASAMGGSSSKASSKAISPSLASWESPPPWGVTRPLSSTCAKMAAASWAMRSAMGASKRDWSDCASKPAWVMGRPVFKVALKSKPPKRRSLSMLLGSRLTSGRRCCSMVSHSSRTGPWGARSQMPRKPTGSICRAASAHSASSQARFTCLTPRQGRVPHGCLNRCRPRGCGASGGAVPWGPPCANAQGWRLCGLASPPANDRPA